MIGNFIYKIKLHFITYYLKTVFSLIKHYFLCLLIMTAIMSANHLNLYFVLKNFITIALLFRFLYLQ